jgi:SlyX protein
MSAETHMTDETLERIQTKIAFLERANSDLSDVVFRQQQQIRVLGMRIKELSERLEAAQSAEQQGSPIDERPPHY